MTGEIKAIAATPLIVTNTIYAGRRLSRAEDGLEDGKIAYGTMNVGVALGQTLKGIRATEFQFLNDSPSSIQSITEFSDSVKKSLNKVKSPIGKNMVKIGKGFGKAIDFASYHINPLIYVTSGVKVLSSDDKVNTAIEEVSGITAMRLCEEGYSRLVGLPQIKKDSISGKAKFVEREGYYRKIPFLNRTAEAINKACKSKHLEALPKGVVGGGMVAASIIGYKLGKDGADKLLYLGASQDASKTNIFAQNVQKNTKSLNLEQSQQMAIAS